MMRLGIAVIVLAILLGWLCENSEQQKVMYFSRSTDGGTTWSTKTAVLVDKNMFRMTVGMGFEIDKDGYMRSMYLTDWSDR